MQGKRIEDAREVIRLFPLNDLRHVSNSYKLLLLSNFAELKSKREKALSTPQTTAISIQRNRGAIQRLVTTLRGASGTAGGNRRPALFLDGWEEHACAPKRLAKPLRETCRKRIQGASQTDGEERYARKHVRSNTDDRGS